MLFPAKARVALAGLAIAGGATAVAVLGPAGSAVGQASPPIQVQIQVNSPATLMDKGAAVDVSVTASCSGQTAFPASIVLNVTESVARRVAFGNQEASIDCTGASQTLDIQVTAGTGSPSGFPPGPSKAFEKGVAIATASIEACTFTTCVSQQVQPTITISK
jgi:hypothetical protein